MASLNKYLKCLLPSVSPTLLSGCITEQNICGKQNIWLNCRVERIRHTYCRTKLKISKNVNKLTDIWQLAKHGSWLNKNRLCTAVVWTRQALWVLYKRFGGLHKNPRLAVKRWNRRSDGIQSAAFLSQTLR